MKIGPLDPNKPIAKELEKKPGIQPEKKKQFEPEKDSVRISGDARRLSEAGKKDCL